MNITMKRTIFALITACSLNDALYGQPFLYVGNTGDTTVSVIDTALEEVTTTIDLDSPLPLTPNYVGIAVTPDEKTVYVACENGSTGYIARIDTATNQLILPTIEIPLSAGTPSDLAITPNGQKAYITCQSSIQILDLATETFETPITSSLVSPSSITIAPNGLYAYASDPGTPAVWPIDLSNNQLGTPVTITSPNQPLGIAITSDSTYAYVAEGQNVLRLNLSNPLNPTTAAVGVPGTVLADLAITADNNTFYVIDNYNATVTPVNISNPASPVVGTAVSIGGLLGSGPWVIVINPNSNLAYVSNQNTSAPGTITILDISNRMTPTAQGSIDVGDNPWSLVIVSAPSSSILPPASVNGCKTRNVFLLQTDFINKITWTPPTSGTTPVKYEIYRDAALTQPIIIIPATGPLEYYDHNRQPNIIDSYYIISIDASGNRSIPSSVTATQPCS